MAQPGRHTRHVAVAMGVALLVCYFGFGAFAWGMPFRDLLRPLRDSGLLQPVDASATARMQEAFGGVAMSMAALFCVPAGMMRRDWVRYVFLGWPLVAFLLPFVTAFSRSTPVFWLSLLAGLTFPLALWMLLNQRGKT